jgi:predicted transport protein
MPLSKKGVRGETLEPLYSKRAAETASNGYSLEDHLMSVPVNIRGIFERLRKRILNLDSSVKEEVRKHSVAYKTTTDFVDIHLQKKQIRVTLHASLNELDDPKGLCKSVPHARHLGNGEVEISMNSLDQIGDVIDLIRQVFERHSEEVYV